MLSTEQSRYVEAIPLLQRSIQIRREEVGDKDPSLAMALAQLGDAYAGLNQYEEAGASFAEGERALPQNDESALYYFLFRRLAFEQLAERWPEAEEDARRVFALSRKIYGDKYPYTWQAAAHLGFALASLGRYDEAEKILVEARAQMRLAAGSDTYDNYLPAAALGAARFLSGRAEAALEPLRSALALTETNFDRSTQQWASNALNLAEALLKIDTKAANSEAKILIDQTISVYEPGVDPVYLGKALINRGLLRQKTGDESSGRADLERASKLFKEDGGNHDLDMARIKKALERH